MPGPISITIELVALVEDLRNLREHALFAFIGKDGERRFYIQEIFRPAEAAD